MTQKKNILVKGCIYIHEMYEQEVGEIAARMLGYDESELYCTYDLINEILPAGYVYRECYPGKKEKFIVIRGQNGENGWSTFQTTSKQAPSWCEMYVFFEFLEDIWHMSYQSRFLFEVQYNEYSEECNFRFTYDMDKQPMFKAERASVIWDKVTWASRPPVK